MISFNQLVIKGQRQVKKWRKCLRVVKSQLKNYLGWDRICSRCRTRTPRFWDDLCTPCYHNAELEKFYEEW